jgi:hypothetical protein
MVVKEGMILAGLGIVIGIACVLALSHLLIALLCGVKLKEAAASCRCICLEKCPNSTLQSLPEPPQF